MESWWFLFTALLTLMGNVICESELNIRSVRNECPAGENILKCNCKRLATGLFVACSHIETDVEFQSHLKSLQGHKLGSLLIRNYKASSFPTTVFQGQEINTLRLQNVEVSDASFRRGQLHFQGLEKSLNTLEISKSFYKNDRPLLNLKLDHLENLQNVILEHNSIPEVGNDWFSSGPKKLSVLILESNNIEELGDRAFSSLENLKLLAVAGNHLSSISRQMLPDTANHLATLDLAYNKIRMLPNDIFSGMPSLREVNLENNLIHMIPKDTWGSVSSRLDSLKLGGNFLQCDEHIKWICDTKLRSSEGKCNTPADKKGLSLQQFCKP